jgi:hypothetical protein
LAKLQLAERFLQGVDEFYEDEPAADLMKLLKRADRDEPPEAYRSNTAT